MRCTETTFSLISATVRLTPSSAMEPFSTTYRSSPSGRATFRIQSRPRRRESNSPRPSTCPVTKWPPSSSPNFRAGSKLTVSPGLRVPRLVRSRVSSRRSMVRRGGECSMIVRQTPLTATLSPTRQDEARFSAPTIIRPSPCNTTVPTSCIIPVNIIIFPPEKLKCANFLPCPGKTGAGAGSVFEAPVSF